MKELILASVLDQNKDLELTLNLRYMIITLEGEKLGNFWMVGDKSVVHQNL